MSNAVSRSQPITLEQLLALNAEIAALSRAGVPLGLGLTHLGRDLPGRLGRWATELGQRLEDGQSLGEALRAMPGVPPVYAAVVSAGIRSGRLAVALEDVASLIRRSTEMRRLIYLSLIYPLLIVGLAFVFFVLMLTNFFPVMRGFYDQLAPQGRALAVLEVLATTQVYWMFAVPSLVLFLLSAWWLRARRGWLDVRGRRARWRRPRRASIAGMVGEGRIAAFTETLAALVDHSVPLPEAIVLAADASGDARLSQSGRELAARIERGEQIDPHEALLPAPRLLSWLLVGNRSPQRLAAALRRAAGSHRQNAMWMSRWLSVSVPLWLTVGIGGSATLLYALAIIWPLASVLFELSKPH